MPTPLNINTITAPGVYVSENTVGAIPAGLSSFNCCYMIGTATAGVEKTPTQVVSLADFTNQFPGSPSLKSVRLFFRNYPSGVLFFVRAQASTAIEFVEAIEESFDPDIHEAGFLICPEAFENLALANDRLIVATMMENLCATEGYDWCCFWDCGPPTVVDTPAEYNIEGGTYNSPRGHGSYFYPYLKDLEGTLVPPSTAVVAIALRRYAEQGFAQPPAGSEYPLRGVLGTAVKITRNHQSVATPMGLNALRYFPNQGVLVYGSRTRSSDPYYRFINGRVILNVLNRSIRRALGRTVFSLVDGQGVLFSRIRGTVHAICYSLWDGGALFGATPTDAFFVKCDRGNNPNSDLSQGAVRVDTYVCLSPTLEKILASTNVTPIGELAFVSGGSRGV
jgi:hypothetical protein